MRWLRHLFDWSPAKRHFPPATLDLIQQTIAEGERGHLGEICFAVEGRLTLTEVLRGRTARQRAEEVFAHLRVWDTTDNTGVLVYLLLADHAIEIVADRGIAARVDQAEWSAVCAQMRQQFLLENYQLGATAGITAIGAILAREFPADQSRNPNERPDRPTVL